MAGIYIHIPYCKQACTYCNFHFSTNTSSSAQMIDAIIAEIVLRKAEVAKQSIETIYFGGGTPGMLPTDDIARIIDAITNNYTVNTAAEITIEVNPDDMKLGHLQAYQKMGINRLSVGTQSFFEEDLLYMNRSHDSKAAARCVQDAQDIGLTNISLDLIYGYPLLTDAKWNTNIQTAFALQVNHISCYAMTVEAKTALQHLIATKQTPAIDMQQSATQFEYLMQTMQAAGWDHYEISNFAKPGQRAKHNTNYWLGENYIGFGPSAHSFDGGSRSWNVANNAQYIAGINNKILPSEKEILTPLQQVNEYIMTSLRMSDGMQLNVIENKISAVQYQSVLQELNKHQHLLTINNNVVKLTNQGKLFADAIASDLFLV